MIREENGALPPLLLLHRKLALFINFLILFNLFCLLVVKIRAFIVFVHIHNQISFWLQSVRQALVEENGVPTRAFMKSFRDE